MTAAASPAAASTVSRAAQRSGAVDLGLGPVAQLEVEAPLGGVDRRLLGLRGVAGVDRFGERPEGVAHRGSINFGTSPALYVSQAADIFSTVAEAVPVPDRAASKTSRAPLERLELCRCRP